jgi:hypothetical protein
MMAKKPGVMTGKTAARGTIDALQILGHDDTSASGHKDSDLGTRVFARMCKMLVQFYVISAKENHWYRGSPATKNRGCCRMGIVGYKIQQL